ncbi:MAG TPA: TAXI family TRAP transporter solute-binding subunit, partial [Paracoccaceae bacterium]|nr:TAXI family TRAP transporter solute-binding subunit [Paracoccaceae bacterium]
GYAYPVLMTYAEQEDDLVYNMTKAMVELYTNYAESGVPGIKGWDIGRQDFTWVAPYHPGAIRYFEEIGVWSDEAQAHNENLIARQEALMTAWEELMAEDPENWAEAWETRRREALEAGGFNVVF